LCKFPKPCYIEKFNFYQKRNFLQLLAQSAQWPVGPFGLSGYTAQPVVFFLLPHWSRARKPPPPASLAPPPWSAPTTSTGWKIMAASLLHSPIKRCPCPSSIPGNWCLQSGGTRALKHQCGRRLSSGELPRVAMATGPWWTRPTWSTALWTRSTEFPVVN
jgi:hypothetical protein